MYLVTARPYILWEDKILDILVWYKLRILLWLPSMYRLVLLWLPSIYRLVLLIFEYFTTSLRYKVQDIPYSYSRIPCHVRGPIAPDLIHRVATCLHQVQSLLAVFLPHAT